VTTKQIAIQTIQQLPDDGTWGGNPGTHSFRGGLRELDEGKGIPHDQVREELAEWLTD
jgi:hypothetical protein